MEYIIQVSSFTTNNDLHNVSALNSIKKLNRVNETKTYDDDELEEMEQKVILNTVSGSVDCGTEAEQPLVVKSPKKSHEKLSTDCQCKSKGKNNISTTTDSFVDKEKQSNKSQLIKELSKISTKNLQSEKIIFDSYPQHIRFSQDYFFNLEEIECVFGLDTNSLNDSIEESILLEKY